MDRDLMDAADLREFERVEIYNISSGTRLATYAIEGPRGSGEVCINGAAAHLVQPGELVIIASYAEYSEVEVDGHRPRVVRVDGNNRPAPAGAASHETNGSATGHREVPQRVLP
jgi:aspartate 1-decarboxylase